MISARSASHTYLRSTGAGLAWGSSMTWFICATGHEFNPQIVICRDFSKEEWATIGPQRPRKRLSRDNATGNLQGKILAGATGLEPATSGVTGRSWRFLPDLG